MNQGWGNKLLLDTSFVLSLTSIARPLTKIFSRVLVRKLWWDSVPASWSLLCQANFLSSFRELQYVSVKDQKGSKHAQNLSLRTTLPERKNQRICIYDSDQRSKITVVFKFGELKNVSAKVCKVSAHPQNERHCRRLETKDYVYWSKSQWVWYWT